MALAQGTGVGGGSKKQKKKKREEPWVLPVSIPRPVYDNEGRAGAIARAYFNRTGLLPSPGKLYTFVKATNNPMFNSQGKFDALFPNWVGEMDKDDEDIIPVNMFLNPSAKAFDEFQRVGRIMRVNE